MSISDSREMLGKLVRAEWIKWAEEQEDPKPHWLDTWDELSEPMKEVDRRIGVAIATYLNYDGLVVDNNNLLDVIGRMAERHRRERKFLASLKAENARLKAEVAELRDMCDNHR